MTILENDIRRQEGRFDDIFKNIDGKIVPLGKWVFVNIYTEEKHGSLVLIESKKTHIRKAKVLAASADAREYGVDEGDDVILADFRMEVLDGYRGFVEYENICGRVEPE